MTGQSWWAFRGSPRHAALLAAGWEESRAWKLAHGERVSVLMVKVNDQIPRPQQITVSVTPALCGDSIRGMAEFSAARRR